MRRRGMVATRTVRLGLLVLPLAAAACTTAPARYRPSAALAALYVPRESWGAAEPTPDRAPMTAVGRLTVHHTGFPEEGGAPAGQVAREVQPFHQEERGWADIGYHAGDSREAGGGNAVSPAPPRSVRSHAGGSFSWTRAERRSPQRCLASRAVAESRAGSVGSPVRQPPRATRPSGASRAR